MNRSSITIVKEVRLELLRISREMNYRDADESSIAKRIARVAKALHRVDHLSDTKRSHARAELEYTHIVAGQKCPWSWNGKPSAKDLKLSGGTAEVRAVYRFPVGARVRWHQQMDEWIVESLYIVGSRTPGESWVETDFPGDKRFRVALRFAEKLVLDTVTRSDGRLARHSRGFGYVERFPLGSPGARRGWRPGAICPGSGRKVAEVVRHELAHRIWDRLVKDGLLDYEPKPDDLKIVRTRAGRHQRSEGAWSWHFDSEKDSFVSTIGSVYGAGEILRARALKLYTNPAGQTEVWPQEA